ncbi:glycosyltransferase [Actinoplanes sp. G11-F43]|uniref:glycosyltransferase n=1 Tax=Actinoplanes sp. G11-F43 TaxID=3424130 RepID=UPI003D32BC5D
MARVLIVTLGTRGDVVPYAALGNALTAAGEHVTIAANEVLRGYVAGEFVPLPVDLTGSGPLTSTRLARLLAERWTAVGRAIAAAADGMDLLLLAPMGWLGYHVAEATGAATMGAFLQPLEPTRAFPPPMLTTRDLGGWGNHAAARAFRLLGQAPFAAATAELRRHLGLRRSGPAATFRRMDQERWPIVYGVSPTVLPPTPDWPAHRPMTGFWWPPAGRGLSPRVRSFLDAGDPPVYLGFGSTSATGADALVAETAARLGRRVVTQHGVPGPDVLVIGDEPHAELFPRMAAVVHHGGAGTTAAALRAGVPSVVVPFTADQPFWARRVAELGAGPAPVPLRRATVDRLISAVASADDYRSGARSVAERLAAEDGTGAAVAVIRRSLG